MSTTPIVVGLFAIAAIFIGRYAVALVRDIRSLLAELKTLDTERKEIR